MNTQNELFVKEQNALTVIAPLNQNQSMLRVISGLSERREDITGDGNDGTRTCGSLNKASVLSRLNS